MIFDGTIRDNILWSRPEATESELDAAIRAADVHRVVERLPEGLDTRVGQRGRRLSGGERQRVAIARAMLRDAPILLLDEPTTGLDAETSDRVLAPLRRLMDGRTTIMITHNLTPTRDADVVVVLDDGRIAEQGPPAALLAAGGAFARLNRGEDGADARVRTPPWWTPGRAAPNRGPDSPVPAEAASQPRHAAEVYDHRWWREENWWW